MSPRCDTLPVYSAEKVESPPGAFSNMHVVLYPVICWATNLDLVTVSASVGGEPVMLVSRIVSLWECQMAYCARRIMMLETPAVYDIFGGHTH